MKTQLYLAFLLTSLSLQVFSFDETSYEKNLKFGNTNSQSAVAVLGVLDSCSGNKMAPDCVLPQLTTISQTNEFASTILSEYARTQTEGKFNKLPECQTQKHKDTNYVLGHCVLVLNYIALKQQSKDAAMSTYQTCLQAGLIGLAYDGNMSAQFLLSKIFKGRGIAQSGDVWERSLDFKKGTEEDLLMRKCYQ